MSTVLQIATTSIYPSKTNPRKTFLPIDSDELKFSIVEKGILQPVIIRAKTDGDTHQFEIIDGERRWRAACELKLETIPCIIEEMTDEQAKEAQLISHLQRKNIHPMEEAFAFEAHIGKLVADNKARRKAIADLSKKIGKPESHIMQRLQLLKLIKEAQKAYTDGDITIEHATLLAKMIDEDQKRAVEFLTFDIDHIVHLSVFKQWIEDEVSLNLKAAPFDKADETLVPGVPACVNCPKNSGYNTALFPELKGSHVCGDRHCFKAKVAAHLEKEKKRIRKEEKRGFIMISSTKMDMDDPLKVDGVKMDGRYKIVKPGKECDDTKRAQWIDGPDKGKFVLVCNYSKCKKHWGGSESFRPAKGDDYNSPASKEKREIANHDSFFKGTIDRLAKIEACQKLLNATEDNIKRPLMREIVAHYEDRFYDQGILKVKKVKKILNDYEACYRMAWIFLSVAIEDELDLSGLFKSEKIDLAKLRIPIAEKYHQCEVCHCFEEDPCPEGCKWDQKFLVAKRHVCSSCTSKAKPIDTQKASSSKSKAGSPKKGKIKK